MKRQGRNFRDPQPCIYVAYVEGDLSHSKIGSATRVRARWSQLQNAHWRTVKIVGVFEIETQREAREIERRIHIELAKQWIRGEWFEIAPSEAVNLVTSLVPRKANPDQLDLQIESSSDKSREDQDDRERVDPVVLL